MLSVFFKTICKLNQRSINSSSLKIIKLAAMPPKRKAAARTLTESSNEGESVPKIKRESARNKDKAAKQEIEKQSETTDKTKKTKEKNAKQEADKQVGASEKSRKPKEKSAKQEAEKQVEFSDKSKKTKEKSVKQEADKHTETSDKPKKTQEKSSKVTEAKEQNGSAKSKKTSAPAPPEEEAASETSKQKSRRRGAKASETETAEEIAENQEEKKSKTKKTNSKNQKAEEGEKGTVQTKAPLLNSTDTKWEEINFSCDKLNSQGKSFNLKITSWNVDGLRAWLKKDGLNILKYDDPDILCLQETKCSEDKLPDEVREIEGYHVYWCCSKKEGYAGVAIYTKTEPISVQNGINDEDHDEEGRCITVEYDQFYLVNVYVPNAGRGLVTLPKRLEWNELFKEYIKQLDSKKPVIVCGDMNVAHTEIDLSNPKTNKKNAGFTQEERDGMTEFLQDGYVDSYRKLYPDQRDVYTFWSYMSKARSKNIGWRLDYFILSERLMKHVCDNAVRSEVFGSDHCPISLFVHI